MAAPEEVPMFRSMTEAELRRWVNTNPTRVNDCDILGRTPLLTALHYMAPPNSPLVLWLLEKGADVNAQTIDGDTPLHLKDSPEVITALLDRGADPCLLCRYLVTSKEKIRNREDLSSQS